MKKYLILTIIFVSVLTMLCSCSLLHTHSSKNWSVDVVAHWQICDECGDITDWGDHHINEDGVCNVCNAELMEFDTTKMIYLYDKNDNPIFIAEYSSDNSVLVKSVYEYIYDESGRILFSKEMKNDILIAMNEYKIINGESVIIKYTEYFENGGYVVTIYDENGEVVSITEF